MLKVAKLNHHINDKPLLHNVSFSVERGELVAILGANGVGKSTLFDCLLGQRQYDSGDITLDDIPIGNLSTRELAQQVALVPQQQDSAFAFSGVEMVLMGRTPYLSAFASPSKQDRQDALTIMANLGADHLAQRDFNQLSGGERQLLLLARAMLQSQNLLLLDEPTNHLDYRNRYHILNQVQQACKHNNTAAVAILHDPNLANLYADKVLMLDHGKTLAFGSTSEVMTNHNISRLYGLTTGSVKICNQELFMPQKLLSQQPPEVLILTGESGSGKTTALEQLVNQNSDQQLPLNGIICPGEMRDGKRFSSDIINVASGERCRFGQRQSDFDPITGTRFQFSQRGIKLGQDALTPATTQHNGIWLVDEIGPMEFNGGGLAKSLAALLTNPARKHIWVIRPSLVQRAINHWGLSNPTIVDAQDPQVLNKLTEFCRR
ncbi:ATP-binding cassette domain-containing protein [Ferrimonas lipolytica]|uniref:ATP-binding cassette domain-containing protein n=1 Tax=Ferrimonas lipolytica TaxID=2724191 RepID=A0A6H1UIM6_9GAMM|nr:ATP-binding cassette domain-containing protein [Ferrimonas lipolytica]QIZ78678.1 ATP-binding cassette domain-containing protein [Ferrimonas lipolytica]